MKHIITGNYKGKKIERIAFSNSQAFVIINQLSREGVTDIGIREDTPCTD